MKLIDAIKAKNGTIGNTRISATFNGQVWVDKFNKQIEDIDNYFGMSPIAFASQFIGHNLQPRVTIRTDNEYWAIYSYSNWRCYQDHPDLRGRFIAEKTETEFMEWLNEL